MIPGRKGVQGLPPDFQEAYVKAFLKRFIQAIEQGRFTFWEDRPDLKNRDTLYLLQYTASDAISEFASLQWEHYRSGPTPDENYPDNEELMVFNKRIDSYDIYMKVKWKKAQDWYIGISFHVREK